MWSFTLGKALRFAFAPQMSKVFLKVFSNDNLLKKQDCFQISNMHLSMIFNGKIYLSFLYLLFQDIFYLVFNSFMEEVQDPAEEKRKESQDPFYDDRRFPRGLPIDVTFPMLSQEDRSQVVLGDPWILTYAHLLDWQKAKPLMICGVDGDGGIQPLTSKPQQGQFASIY